ncbi:MAG: JAB domain-containing protein [Myxococcota bacterium]
MADRLSEYSVASVLASSDAELQKLGLSKRERHRVRAMESLVLRSRYERAIDPALLTPKDAAELVIAELWGEHVETVVVAVLNIHSQAILVERVHQGGVDQCIVDPREVFRPALLARGSSIIIGHNHPGGDPNPSRSDIELTERLGEAGEMLSIPLVDHIVLGGIDTPVWTSFAERGFLHGIRREAS